METDGSQADAEQHREHDPQREETIEKRERGECGVPRRTCRRRHAGTRAGKAIESAAARRPPASEASA